MWTFIFNNRIQCVSFSLTRASLDDDDDDDDDDGYSTSMRLEWYTHFDGILFAVSVNYFKVRHTQVIYYRSFDGERAIMKRKWQRMAKRRFRWQPGDRSTVQSVVVIEEVEVAKDRKIVPISNMRKHNACTAIPLWIAHKSAFYQVIVEMTLKAYLLSYIYWNKWKSISEFCAPIFQSLSMHTRFHRPKYTMWDFFSILYNVIRFFFFFFLSREWFFFSVRPKCEKYSLSKTRRIVKYHPVNEIAGEKRDIFHKSQTFV